MSEFWNKHKVKVGAALAAFGAALEAGTGLLQAAFEALQTLF